MPSRNNNKSNKNRNQKKNNKSRNNKKHSKKSQNRLKHKNHNSHTRKNTHRQSGGFNSCALATVQEPGFTIPAIGDVPGFSLADSKGAINRPNCKTDTYQAMTPL